MLGEETVVVRNDAIDAGGVAAMAPEAIVLSPGPCTPVEAGCCMEVVQRLHRSTPILGVCLGHQAIGAAFGADVVRAPRPMHGQASSITHDGRGVFAGLPSPLSVGRYHSLVVDSRTLPVDLVATATTSDGLLMAMQHARLPTVGVQFHPESILTNGGLTLLENFVAIAREYGSRFERPRHRPHGRAFPPQLATGFAPQTAAVAR